MADFVTVYLSSTYEDLKPYREAVYKALNQLQGVKVIAMEDYVARDDRPLAECLNDVAGCDIYVGLFAWRYGYVPPAAENPEGRSITELEFRRAKSLAKPCLIHVLDEGMPWQRAFDDTRKGQGGPIEALRAELLRDHMAKLFTDPAPLATAVANAVSNAVRARNPAGAEAAAAAQPLQRELRRSLYLAHHPADRAAAEALAAALAAGQERPALLSAEGLFARDAAGFAALEASVTTCHAAAVLLTAQSLAQLATQAADVAAALALMRARTGALALLAVGVDAPLPPAWTFDARFDLPAGAAHDVAAARAWLARRQPPAGLRSIGVPVCVVAMTATECAQLENDAALIAQLTAAEREGFDALRQALAEEGIDWRGRYGAMREAWCPFRVGGDCLHSIAVQIANAVAAREEFRKRSRHVWLQGYPFDALVAGPAALRPIYRGIARAGCIVLVDEMSLFHPVLREAFNQSPFFNNDQVAIITLSPFDPGREPGEALLEQSARKRLAGALDRYAQEYDPQCELAVGDERRLRRWLHTCLPATVVRLQKPQPDRSLLEAMRAEVGEASAGSKGEYLWGGGGGT